LGESRQQENLNILELKDVAKHFGGIHAVDGVSLNVRRGSITGLIGPNGSGKSTLFNVITGIEKSDGGKIAFQGKNIDNLPPHRIFQLGLVRTFQTPRLFFGMTVLENSLLPSRNQKGESPLVAPFPKRWEQQELTFARKSRDQMRSLEIDELYQKQSTEISGGQMKLLQLDMSLMGEPKMLLLDEPTAGVAPRLAQDIFQSIDRQRRERSTSFFIIEHRLQVFLRYVDYVYVMHRGKIISEGKPDAIMKDQRVVDAYLGS
jgi:branched-chain amino acid transport system ATP-binding protein